MIQEYAIVLVLAKAAGLFLMPPGILLLGGVAALVLAGRFPRTGRLLALGVLLAAYLLSIRPVSEGLLQPLEDAYPPLAEVPPEAEAIVVLGGGQVPGSPEYAAAAAGDATLQRTRYAARLARDNDLPVFTTGGLPLGRGVPTGTLMARALSEDFGLRRDRLRTETTARNTREHVPYLKTLLGERRRVVLVTTAWHMPRAMATFRAGGLDPLPAPTDYHPGYGGPYHWLDLLPQAGYLDMSSNACHEYLGMAYYGLRGWLG